MTVDTSREAVQALIADLNDCDDRFVADTLAALLDERDKILALRSIEDGVMVQRIRDLEDDLAGARGIRDREKTRAERAEAELLHARGISEIREAERDRLAAKAGALIVAALDAILADTDEPKEQSNV